MKNILILTAFLVLFSCKKNEETTNQDQVKTNENELNLTDAQIKNADLAYEKLQKKQISSVLKLNGQIDVPPQNMVSISVPLGGYLKNSHLLPGMHVKKGEIIAVVEDQQYIQLQQDYLLTKSKITYSQQEYNRQRDLNESKASSDKVFQQATEDLNSLKITLNGLTEKLRLIGKNPSSISQKNISRTINIYAPINGFVSKVNVNIGKYISPTEIMFELVDPSDIHLALKVFEKDIDKLFIGQKLMAFTNSNPSKKYACEVLLIGKDFSGERNTDVHCHFETYDKNLIPGTYMNAEIEVKSATNFALPEDSVVDFENKQYAFIQNSKNKFEMVEVQTGTSENGFIEILNSDTFENKTFVTKGAYTLLMSLKNKSEE